MRSPFDRLMSQLLKHTFKGQLNGATAAIRSALRQLPKAPAAARYRDVIDIKARVVEPRPVGTPAPQTPVPRGTARAATAAFNATAAPTPAVPPTAARAAAGSGRFISGRHSTRHGNRAYKLFIPADARPGAGQPLPLVVMLHGCTQNPDDFAAGTRMNDAARRDGFYVLYPEQSREHNPQGCWNWFKHSHQTRERGEPAILASMVSAVVAEQNAGQTGGAQAAGQGIDPHRIYVAGLSAGGAMAAILGQTHPDLFAAVGVHSGLAAGAARDMPSAFSAMRGRSTVQGKPMLQSPRPPPTIVFHGDEDRTVHPINGERVLDGVDAHEVQPLAGQQGRGFTRHLHRDEEGQVLAEHWVVHGAGHAWSGGSTLGSYADGSGPDATEEMLRFFSQHRLARTQGA